MRTPSRSSAANRSDSVISPPHASWARGGRASLAPALEDLASFDDAHRQTLQAIGEVRAQTRRRTGQLDRFEARQELLEEHRHLEPREVRAEAEVRPAAPEGRVHVALAREIEPVRVGEGLRVAV